MDLPMGMSDGKMATQDDAKQKRWHRKMTCPARLE
jgi:hypothetical protein